MLLRLGHSPDSDDAFMFWALASPRVTAPGIEFEHTLRDIETLNRWALEGRLECTAISAHAYAYVADRYSILSHGASMGDGYGPKVVTTGAMAQADLGGRLIAVPGEMTSAFLALRLWWPGDVVPESRSEPARVATAPGGHAAGILRYRVVPFDAIMEAVDAGSVDAGLIIHEGQLTYGDEGLHQVEDLGAWWLRTTGLPLPLGVNTIRRDLPADVQLTASRALRDSIVCGLENREEALTYAMRFARGLQAATADEFVGMYVNDWTVDMGERGRRSIETFLKAGAARGFIAMSPDITFVD
ncbi:MAG: ABC transporter substrate-binding protein [Armatimonadetes bacterium]|nr:ABC transporter substrate-binding protein [Armatimonadota bacterium]